MEGVPPMAMGEASVKYGTPRDLRRLAARPLAGDHQRCRVLGHKFEQLPGVLDRLPEYR